MALVFLFFFLSFCVFLFHLVFNFCCVEYFNMMQNPTEPTTQTTTMMKTTDDDDDEHKNYYIEVEE